jgi:hypothetical protein
MVGEMSIYSNKNGLGVPLPRGWLGEAKSGVLDYEKRPDLNWDGYILERGI